MKLSEKLHSVFTPQEIDALAPQQVAMLNNKINRVIDTEGEAALTRPRLEGIKEMMTEHLWPAGLTIAETTWKTIDGFVSLSPDFNYFSAEVAEPFFDQVLNAIEIWTAESKTFPVVIAIRKGKRAYLLFRHPDEEAGTTESTALAMVVAYAPDELVVCTATDVLGGLKAFLVTVSRTTESNGIFFDLEKGKDRWQIGEPIGKIDPNTLEDYTGATAFRSFNNSAERARMYEARKALTEWKPSYDWCFENQEPIERKRYDVAATKKL